MTPSTTGQHMLDAWQAQLAGHKLNGIQQQCVDVIMQHPEYHQIFANHEQALQQQFSTDSNPFLHIALHLSLNEQIKLDRPKGIHKLWQNALMRNGNAHALAHKIMDIMANMLWDAQHNKQLISDQCYLEKLMKSIT